MKKLGLVWYKHRSFTNVQIKVMQKEEVYDMGRSCSSFTMLIELSFISNLCCGKWVDWQLTIR